MSPVCGIFSKLEANLRYSPSKYFTSQKSSHRSFKLLKYRCLIKFLYKFGRNCNLNCFLDPETMSPLHVRSEVCIAPFHVQSKVCIAPFHVRSKVYKFAPHMDGSNADFAPHMEESHADFAPHMEQRHSCRDQKKQNMQFLQIFKNIFFKPPIF